MKNSIQIHININILIPVTFGLFSFLSFILGSFFKYSSWEAYSLALILGSITSISAFLIIRMILKPAEKLTEKFKNLENQNIDNPPKEIPRDQIEEIKKVFGRIENILESDEKEKFFPRIITSSPIMKSELKKVLKASSSDVSVLITGESGTGKELVADAVFSNSPRNRNPFIKINCAAIPENLVESELFGHCKGAFTGAVSNKKGKFQLAHKGTVFLDEIGDMPMDIQAKILRVLENGEIYPVGSEKSIKVNVRVIAATNKNLSQMVSQSKFREDLFYRLSVILIKLPPLRERKEDIEEIARHFAKSQSDPVSISESAMDKLTAHNWPGNIRELKNVIQRGYIYSKEGVISTGDLPFEISGMDKFSLGIKNDNGNKGKVSSSDLDTALHRIEVKMIEHALNNTRGIQARAAEELGISQRSLWNRVKKYSIDVKRFKE